MEQTDCLGISFPQCDPPLTKDASHIKQFKDLALQVDTAVQAYADALDTDLINPDAVVMSGGQNVAGRDIVHFYSAVVFDNGGLADTVADGIRFVRSGWYMIGGWIRAGAATSPASGIGLRIEPLRNGDTFSARQGPGRPTVAVPSSTDDVAWSDVAFFNSGDFLNTMTHHADSAALTLTYTTQIWALLVAANV